MPRDADERRLAFLGILAGALADGIGARPAVEEVVGDLEGGAERLPIGAESLSRRGIRPGEDGAGLDRKGEERAGLHRLEAPDFRLARGGVAVAPSAARSSIWPPAMPASPAGAGKPEDEVAPHRGVGMNRRIGEALEGERLERVAGEDRRRLVEGAMDARLAAAQVVVVHRRQIVVDERVAMQELDRGAGLHNSGVVALEEAGGLDDEERPQALAAGERRVPHRRHQPRRAGDIARTRRVG